MAKKTKTASEKNAATVFRSIKVIREHLAWVARFRIQLERGEIDMPRYDYDMADALGRIAETTLDLDHVAHQLKNEAKDASAAASSAAAS